MIWETNLEDHRMDVSLIASVGIDLGKTTSDRRYSQQAGPDRLGGIVPPRELPA